MTQITKFASFTVLAAAFCGAGLNAWADYPGTVLSLNPVAYYRLNETNPPAAADSGTNLGSAGALGTLYYIDSPTHGGQGALLGETNTTSTAFSGAGGERAATAYGAPYVPTGPFSVDGWFNPSGGAGSSGIVVAFSSVPSFDGAYPGVTYGTYRGWYVSQGTNDWELVMYNGQLSGTALDVTGGGAPVTDGSTWYHVAATYDGTNASLYVNGALVAGGAPVGYVPNTVSQFSIAGGNNGASYWAGSVQEVALYTNALAASNILAHYQNGTNTSPSPSYSTLVLSADPFFYYRLNDAPYTAPSPSTFPSATNSAASVAGVVGGLYEPGTTPGAAGPPFPGMGVNSGACQFSGIVGGVNLQLLSPLPTTPNATAGPLTLMLWYKANGTSLDNNWTFGNGNLLSWSDFTWRLGRNRLTQIIDWDCNGISPGTILGQRDMADGQWHHLVAVYDLTNKWLYEDGVVLATQPASGSIPSTTGEMDIGWNSAYGTFNGRVWNGSISDVAIWTNALTAAQISQIYGSVQVGPAFFQQTLLSPPGPVYEGQTVTLSVGVQGSLPLYLQWTRNSNSLAGQTSSTLVLSNVTVAADNGSYALIASNSFGVATSSVVALSVIAEPPVFVQQPASATRSLNGFVTFAASAVGTVPISYQWQYNSTPIPGATAASLTLTGLQLTNAGTYNVVATNPRGPTPSSNAVLTVNGVATNYASAIVALGPSAYWRLNETSGTTAYDYIGGNNGTIVGGVTLGAPGPTFPGLDAGNTAFVFDGTSGVIDTPLLINGFEGTFTALVNVTTPTYAPGIMMARGGPGSCCGLGLNTDGASLQYIWDNQGNTYGWDPFLQISPNNWCFVAVSVGEDQTIMYVDTGSGLLSATNDVLSFNASETGPLLIGYDNITFAGEPPPYFTGGIDEPAYFDRALTPAEITALDHTLFTGGASGAQPILIQPASQTAFKGSPASFTVSAVGDMPLTYQWQLSNTNIPGATGQTLLIPSVHYSDAGLYQVIVSNSVSASTSQPAQLTVLDPAIMANVTYGLVAHYKFDGDCTDSSGYAHNGTPFNSPPFVPGKIGQAIQVGNSSSPYQYVALGDPTDFQFNAGDSFSVALWLNYTNRPGDLPIIGNSRNSTYNSGWVLADGNCDGAPGKIESSLDGANFYDNVAAGLGGALVNDGKWHHLAMAIDETGNVVSIYIDGALVQSFAGTVGSLNSGYQTIVGSDPTGGYQGCAPGGYTIDDLGIWRRALTAAEVAGIYAAGNSSNSFDSYGPVQLTTKLTATGQLQISWQQGMLQSSTNLAGTWTNVTNATAPVYLVTPTNRQQFYRVQ